MTIRILLCDDSVVIRKLLTQTLDEVDDFEVVAAVGLGRLALDKIPEVRPDVVILDVEMPELDGIATLKLLRKAEPRLPVIMFSTRTEAGASATIEALTSGASDYVTKPSNVGTPSAAVKFPSEPPPTTVSSNAKPISAASSRACSKRAIFRSERGIGGRLTPPVISNCASASAGANPRIAFTTCSPSSDVQNRTSTLASASAGTTLMPVPPFTMPTLTVTPCS